MRYDGATGITETYEDGQYKYTNRDGSPAHPSPYLMQTRTVNSDLADSVISGLGSMMRSMDEADKQYYKNPKRFEELLFRVRSYIDQRKLEAPRFFWARVFRLLGFKPYSKDEKVAAAQNIEKAIIATMIQHKGFKPGQEISGENGKKITLPATGDTLKWDAFDRSSNRGALNQGRLGDLYDTFSKCLHYSGIRNEIQKDSNWQVVALPAQPAAVAGAAPSAAASPAPTSLGVSATPLPAVATVPAAPAVPGSAAGGGQPASDHETRHGLHLDF